jgi:hypothetical protein
LRAAIGDDDRHNESGHTQRKPNKATDVLMGDHHTHATHEQGETDRHDSDPVAVTFFHVDLLPLSRLTNHLVVIESYKTKH